MSNDEQLVQAVCVAVAEGYDPDKLPILPPGYDWPHNRD